MADTTFEQHYTIAELAKLWNYSKEVIRQLVIQEGDDVPKKRGPNGKIAYRIPESVARRIHTRLIAPEKVARPQRPGLSLAR